MTPKEPPMAPIEDVIAEQKRRFSNNEIAINNLCSALAANDYDMDTEEQSRLAAEMDKSSLQYRYNENNHIRTILAALEAHAEPKGHPTVAPAEPQAEASSDRGELLPCPFCAYPIYAGVQSRNAKTSSGKHWFVRCPICRCEGGRSTTSAGDAAKAWNTRAHAGAGELVAWMYQHDETGRMTFIDAFEKKQPQWEQNNPRWKLVCPLYASPATE